MNADPITGLVRLIVEVAQRPIILFFDIAIIQLFSIFFKGILISWVLCRLVESIRSIIVIVLGRIIEFVLIFVTSRLVVRNIIVAA